MGFSKSSIETLVRKGFIEKYDTTVERDPFATRVFEQDQKQQLTQEQQDAYDAILETINKGEQRIFYYMA